MENDLNDEKSYKKFGYAAIATAVIAAVVILGQFIFEDSKDIQTEEEKADSIRAEYEEIDDIQPEYEQQDESTEEIQEVHSKSSAMHEQIDEGIEILRRFRSVDWESIHPRSYHDDSDWYTNVFCLAELPEDGITMYGYNDEDYHCRGVAIAIDDNIYYFDWAYFSPRQILPQMYWNDEDQQLQITFCTFTGTGVQAEDLYVLQMSEENKPENNIFASGEYDALLCERISFSYEKDTHMITFYDNQDNSELARADLSWLEDTEVERIVFGDIGRFQLGDEIYLIFTPGYMVEEWASPQYDEIPEMKAQVQLEKSDGRIDFGLGEIGLAEGE